MSSKIVQSKLIWATVVLAAALWFITFYLTWSNFWIKISFSAAILAILSIGIQKLPPEQLRLGRREIIQGLFSAAILYMIFWLGKWASTSIFPFASGQISAIYGKGDKFPLLVVFFILLLITGPCEEIFWRGFLQRNLMVRYGKPGGWFIATAIYTGVHIWSFNFMLIGAAAVAGAFWGLLYWRWNNLTPVIISHAIWSAFVFAVVPIP
jgi:membrane protease YdiL (CAAX protease family)